MSGRAGSPTRARLSSPTSYQNLHINLILIVSNSNIIWDIRDTLKKSAIFPKKVFSEISSQDETLERFAHEGLNSSTATDKTSDIQHHHQMKKSSLSQDESYKTKTKTVENDIPVSEEICSEIECEQCTEQKQSKSFDEMTAEIVNQLTPFISLEPQTLAKCLELKPTLNDADNIFNCIFGRLDMYGTYACSEGEKHRIDLSDSLKSAEFLTQYQAEVISMLSQFIKGVTDKKNFPQACKVNSELKEFDQQKLKDLESLKEELEKTENEEIFKALYSLNTVETTTTNEEENKKQKKEAILDKCPSQLRTILDTIDDQFPFQEKIFDSSIIDEYCQFLTFPGQKLGHAELSLIAVTRSKKIHVYVESEDFDGDDIFEHEETINVKGDTEHYVLMREDGSFQRLELNKQRFHFLVQSACQNKIYQKLVSDLRPAKMQDLAKTYLMVQKVVKKWKELLQKAKEEKKKVPKR